MQTEPSKKPGSNPLIPPAYRRLDPDARTGPRRHLLRALRTATLVIRDFINDHCLLHASALTFSTILAIVPFFALIFALLKGLGAPDQLEPYILGQVAAGSQEVVSRIILFINNTNMGSLGAAGLIALIITVFSLLGNIEASFNVIWGVHEDRTLSRKLSDYLSVLTIVPILILVDISITTVFNNRAIVSRFIPWEYLGEALPAALQLVPYASVWLAFTALYRFVPNTRVHLSSAFIGGVFAGTIWQIAQWGYVYFQIGVGRYNAIYGALSLLPIFMVWLFTSWLIELFGVEVAYAHQNRATLRMESHGTELSPAARLELSLTLLVACAVSFRNGVPLSVEQMATRLSLPVRQVKQTAEELEQSGLLTRLAGETPLWHQIGRAHV